jgi:hypothetical protein
MQKGYRLKTRPKRPDEQSDFNTTVDSDIKMCCMEKVTVFQCLMEGAEEF